VNSLRTRVVVVASLVLAVFLGVTGVTLESAFRDTGLELVRERLQAQVYALLAAADPAPEGGLELGAVAEPRFSLPESGLYAQVRDGQGHTVWRSASLLGRDLRTATPALPGDPLFSATHTSWGEDLFTLSYRVRWELGASDERLFDLQVGESRRSFDERLTRFRHDLWLRLAALAAGLLLTQALVLTLGLGPVRRLARELSLIESGERQTLSEDQPQELRRVAANMNHLIRFERQALERHRNALADLAHALKTPLAVLRGAAEDAPTSNSPLRETVLDSVARMDESLSYRLRRASAAGESTVGAAVELRALAERLMKTFLKVYADKGLSISIDAEDGLAVRADSGDLTEILGNLMDNGCKWAQSRVELHMHGDGRGRGVVFAVHDDGPGIPAHQREHILKRGVRADERTSGQGLGLSLVRELVVEHYGGSISVEDAPLGGALVKVRLDVAVR